MNLLNLGSEIQGWSVSATLRPDRLLFGATWDDDGITRDVTLHLGPFAVALWQDLSIQDCICTAVCDCQAPNRGLFSNECPEHNEDPRPNPDCEAEVHRGGQQWRRPWAI